MSRQAVEPRARPTPARGRRGPGTATGTLTGCWLLVRFMLRRDRVKLPGWALVITLFTLYYTMAVRSAYPTEADIEGAAQMLEGPMGDLLVGPRYGFDHLSYERFFVGAYGIYITLLAGMMSILLVSRHTRLEEQAGRSELVRANVVGRHAPLTAALVVAVATNAVTVVFVTATMVAVAGFGLGGSLLFACGVGALGMAFAGLTAVTVQVTEFSRAAAGLAGAGLGAAFAIRAVGDVIEEHGSAVSWLSPLAWSQQTAPFVLDRWWPLALSLGFAVVTVAVGYVLSTQRDVAAGLLAVRPGPAAAPAWVDGPFTLAVRLQRRTTGWWAVTFALSGLVYGAFTKAMVDAADDLPESLLTTIGPREDIVDGYLGLMAVFFAMAVGIYVVLAVQGLRNEETSGRLEPVLATATSRWAWFSGNLAVIVLGSAVVLLAAGLGTGVGAAAVTGDRSWAWKVALAHAVQMPAVLVVVAVAVLLYGAAPRLVGVTWVVLAYSLVTGVFGPLLELPGWTYDLSPFEHVARMPLEPFTLPPLIVLTGLAVTVATLGMVGFRRRGVTGP